MRSVVLAVVALGANALLFALVGWSNGGTRVAPPREKWVVREVFHAAAPPREARIDSGAEAVHPEAAAPAPSMEPAETAASPASPAESFDLRLGPAALDRSALGVQGMAAGPALRVSLFSGGSPFGVQGGVAGGTGTPGVFDVGQVDTPPQRLSSPLPPYPQWARVRKLEGVVLLKFVVEISGEVRDPVIESVEGDERFGDIAKQAVLRWRFEPGIYGGKRVATIVSQRVRFVLVDR